jgi:DNA polymerase III subunit delta
VRPVLLHVFVGEDDFSIRQALEEIKKAIGDPAALVTNTTVLEGPSLSSDQLRAACQTVPFLADKRLVVVEGLLERFEPKARPRKKSTRSPAAVKTDDPQPFVDAVRELPPFTELVLIGAGKLNASPAGNPLLRGLAAVARVRTFPRLNQRELGPWIERRAAAAGAAISQTAVTLLARFVGSDLGVMAGEVDKLALYAGGRRIEEADVRAVVSYAREATVFAMVDAILEGRTAAAQQTLQQLLLEGESPAQLLVMLARQVRIIFQIRDMRGRGLARGEIQTRLGLTSDFVLRKAWDQADRYSAGRLKEIYHRLLEADIAIKTGKFDSNELAIDILIAEMGQPVK